MFWVARASNLPTLIAAQAPATDRLTLDQYLDFETVTDPQISPDGSQIIYTRGWVDKVNDARVVALDHERRRQQEPLPGRAAAAPAGRPPAIASPTRRTGEPRARRSSCATWTPKARSRRSRASRRRPATSRGRLTAPASPSRCTSRTSRPGRSRCRSAPEGAKWTETPRIVERLDYRQDGKGFDDDGYRHIFVVPATGGTPRQLTDGNWTSQRRRVDARRQADPVRRRCACADAEYQWRESEIYAVDVDTGDDHAADDAQGSGRQPEGLARRQARRLHGLRLVEGHVAGQQALRDEHRRHRTRASCRATWDRSPQSLTWKDDGNGVYFTAQDRARRTSTSCRSPAARADEVQTRDQGHAHADDVEHRQGQGRRRR